MEDFWIYSSVGRAWPNDSLYPLGQGREVRFSLDPLFNQARVK